MSADASGGAVVLHSGFDLSPPPRRASKASHVYDTIKESILSSELAPGSAIDKLALCERLGMSRFPVSTAVNRLAFEKLVVIEPQHGSFVSRISLTTGKTTGTSPSGEVYVGYLWDDGVTKNECGFAISGGTVAADGSSTKPNAFAYTVNYTTGGSNGATIYPGCVVTAQPVASGCDAGTSKNCTWTANFTINQTR